jgi:hypothetical protein
MAECALQLVTRFQTDETIQFDHIKAYSDGFPSELHNIAPMCAQHNREKGTLSLEDFRTKLRMNEFFASGDKLTLKQLLEHLKGKDQIDAFGLSVAPAEWKIPRRIILSVD